MSASIPGSTNLAPCSGVNEPFTYNAIEDTELQELAHEYLSEMNEESLAFYGLVGGVVSLVGSCLLGQWALKTRSESGLFLGILTFSISIGSILSEPSEIFKIRESKEIKAKTLVQKLGSEILKKIQILPWNSETRSAISKLITARNISREKEILTAGNPGLL